MKVSIVECAHYDEKLVAASVKKAISDIGFEIPTGKKVLVKPNVLGQHTPNEAITTHPYVVEAVVKIFLDNKNEVMIAESSGFFKDGGTLKALEMSGMKYVCDKYKIPLINLETKTIREIDDPKAAVYKKLQISGLIFDVDMIVNVPKLKTHNLMLYTGAVKNLFGTIPGGRKQKLHVVAQEPSQFGELLVDIYQNIKPALNIMDAVIGLEGNGPGSAGIPKQTGLILASENAPALDIIASGVIGYNPLAIYTNKICFERGLVGKVEVIGKKKSVNYKKPINISHIPKFVATFFIRQAVMKPFCIKKNCVKCGVCASVCPVKAIKLEPYPLVDYEKCINCYCCHETCPHSAMDLKGSALFEVMRKVKEMVFRK
jgi:uncharacterized protein (DUF362 family)